MAQQLLCDLCGQEVAALMQTNIGNGDVIAIGNSCLLPFTLTVAGEILDTMPAEIASQYGDALAPVVAKLANAMTNGAAAAGPGASPEALEAPATAPADGGADGQPPEAAQPVSGALEGAEAGA